MTTTTPPGRIEELWSYPVKSMQGGKLDLAHVQEGGLLGDRAYALIDVETGRVVSAKDTGKWPDLFSYRAAYLEPPQPGDGTAPIAVILPNGHQITSLQSEVDELLSTALGRRVRLEVRTVEGSGASGFFDLAVVHLLTTASLERLRELYPQGRFEATRFRPNLVVRTDERGFVENDWVGRTLRIGDRVRLQVTRRCLRCVMTTLPQADLPRDPGILKAAAKHNEVSVGVYANVLRGGTVRRGDALELEELRSES